jgi:protein gp37
LVPEKFQDPFHWAKPRRVFVNSMSDLFHEDVPFEFIDKVFDVMTQCDWHKFQVLTKRPERMRQYMEGYCKCSGYHRDNYNQWARICAKNVWLGVSVEDQKRADERIPVLLDTPASLRFLSCEPLLGPVNLAPYINETVSFMQSGTRVRRIEKALHWVIVGGESGPRRRPMDLDWARQIRDECRAAGTDFYFKQTGGSRSETGQLLDGARWEQMP